MKEYNTEKVQHKKNSTLRKFTRTKCNTKKWIMNGTQKSEKVKHIEDIKNKRKSNALEERNTKKTWKVKEIVKHEESTIRKKCNMKKIATWEECKTRKGHHGNSETLKECNMEKSAIWK